VCDTSTVYDHYCCSHLFELVVSLFYDLFLAPLHIGHWLCIHSAKPVYTASGPYGSSV
jgi:hypothetical protein